MTATQTRPHGGGRKPPALVSDRQVTAEELRGVEWKDPRELRPAPQEAICLYVSDHAMTGKSKEAGLSAAAALWLHNHGMDTVLVKQSQDGRYLAVLADPLGLPLKQRKRRGGGWYCTLRAPVDAPSGTYLLSALPNGMLVCAMPEPTTMGGSPKGDPDPPSLSRSNDNGSR